MLGEGGDQIVAITDFSGGETDSTLNGKPNQNAALRNLLIREDNKAYIRDGFEIYDTATKTSDTSSFMTVVKPMGQTSSLKLRNLTDLLVHTKGYVSRLISTTWTPTTLNVIDATGSPATFGDNCGANWDSLNGIDYMCASEGYTKWANPMRFYSPSGTESISRMGLPKPDSGVYNWTLAHAIDKYNQITLAFKDHALNLTHPDHAHTQVVPTASHPADILNGALPNTDTFDQLFNATQLLWNSVYEHMRDARLGAPGSLFSFHSVIANFYTGFLSFYPKTFPLEKDLTLLYSTLYDLALVVSLHSTDIQTWDDTGGAPLRQYWLHNSAGSIIDLGLDNESEWGLYTAVASFRRNDSAILGDQPFSVLAKQIVEFFNYFTYAAPEAPFVYYKTIILNQFNLPTPNYTLIQMIGAWVTMQSYVQSNNPGTITPIYPNGDAGATPIPNAFDLVHDLASARSMVTFMDGFLNSLHSLLGGPARSLTSIVLSNCELKSVLFSSWKDANNSVHEERSESQDISLTNFVLKYTRSGNNYAVQTIGYGTLPYSSYTVGVPSTTYYELYRLDESSGIYYYVNQYSLSLSTMEDYPATLLTTRKEFYASPTFSVVENGTIEGASVFFITNNCAWFGDVLVRELDVETLTTRTVRYPNRLYQSIQNDPTSVPSTFYVELGEDIKSGSHVLTKPIIMTSKAVYRIDGLFNEDGSGGLIAEQYASLTGGTSPWGAISVNSKVYFAGENNLYMTDGYQAQWIGMNKEVSYKDVLKDRVKVSYHKQDKSLYWSISHTTVGYDKFWIMNLEKPITDESCITTLDGLSLSSPCSTVTDTGEVIVGDKDGFVFKSQHYLMADAKVNRSSHSLVRNYLGTILTDYIPFDYRSLHHNFGTTRERKWVTQYEFVIQNSSQEFAENFTAQPYYSNDVDKLTDKGGAYTMRPIHIEMHTEGVFVGKRMFSAGTLRCMYKQVGFVNGSVLLDDDVESASTGTVVTLSHKSTFVLNGVAHFELSDYVGCFLYLENDNYVTAYPITGNNGTPFVTPPNTLIFDIELPVAVNKKWKIRGVPKTERWTIQSVTIPTAVFSVTEQNQKVAP